MARKFSSISIETTLAISLTNTATSMTVITGTGSGLLGGVTLAPGNVDTFMVAIEPDTVNEELVAITAASADTFTIIRGQGGTSAIAHTTGATVRHVLTGADLTAFESTSLSVAGKIGATAFTAAGQLLAGTGNATYTALSAGTTGQVLTVNPSTSSGLEWATFTPGVVPLVTNTQTASYTLVLTDAGKNIEMNVTTANNLTVPTNATVAFPVGTQILISQIGAGQTTVVAASGVTIQSNGNKLKLTGQYAQASLLKRDTNTWILSGNLAV